ncbi:DUF6093 family protein [Kitasatospora sp. NPDC052868]|uniref:DUF6093 family protein n=1 Tax=Kitasatospora sp. NPDC052868 TaxID=3364060 RepID=UPI0037C79B31
MSALDALLTAGRTAHQALMIDQITLLRPGPDIYDPVTGETTPGTGQTLYTGPARVKPFQAVSEDVPAGERAVVLRRYEVALPWTTVPAGQVLPGDRVLVTASPDPRLAALDLWVTSAGASATATAWRIEAEDRS